MLQGWVNAPAVWMRGIATAFGGMLWRSCAIYVDDCTVSSSTPLKPKLKDLREDVTNKLREIGVGNPHKVPVVDSAGAPTQSVQTLLDSSARDDTLFLQHYADVFDFFERCRKYRYTISIPKTQLFVTDFELLGFRVSERGVQMTEARVSGFLNWKRPLIGGQNEPVDEDRGDTADHPWYSDTQAKTCEG